MKRIIFPIAALALSSSAMAHPHKNTGAPDSTKSQRAWPYFGKKHSKEDTSSDARTLSATEFAERIEKRFKRHSEKVEKSFKSAESKNSFLREDREIKNAEDLRNAARAIEDLISESAIISSFADLMLDLAEDFDIETSDGGLALKFDGERIGRVKVKRDKHTDSSLDVEGFGRNMTIEKEVIKRGGKTKTRIVIEVDGDEEFDIDLKPKN